ncbi:MAG: MBL fold metallo-hydrolase [Planctomycetaceae bacterium]|nr:MBL fold metallo-hydrolase [Planctomycetaceae bacterium]
MSVTVEQIYTGCLAQGAYYIESNGEAAVIDPLREVQPYLDLAESRGARIKYVFETHFHADFVSGHVDLAAKSGAQIVFGPTTMQTGFDAQIARDGQEFPLGDCVIRLLHTPGHTPESSCYLLLDPAGKATSLFTGDTLFIGDVGRPDLAQKVVAELTQEKLASMLFDSLRNKIMPLADDIVVYPGHGAGSACGKNMSKETTDTLGNQKRVNYALEPSLDREAFIEAVLSGLTQPPSYFPQNVLMNIGGYQNVDAVIAKATTPLSVAAFREAMSQEKVAILDTRDANDFALGHVPGSINISLQGMFANWVGVVFRDVKQPLLLITAPGKEEEAAIRLARVGFDRALGYLQGGVVAWSEAGQPVEKIQMISAAELARVEKPLILDVRRESEYFSQHMVGAVNAPLDYWWEQLDKLDRERTQYVYCRSGYRSMIFVSIMKSRGFGRLVNVVGGFQAIEESGKFPITDYVCPSTML